MGKTSEPPVLVRRMDRAFDLLSRICTILAGAALVIMTAIFAWLVFGRYVLNDTPTWVEQVSLLLVMVIAFLGAAVGVNQNTHLSVVLFRSIVPSWLRTGFVIVTDVLMAGFGGMMFWYGTELTAFKWNTLIPLIQWSEGLRSLPLTVCGALVCLFSTGHLIRLFLGWDDRKDSIE
ncbi:TRAP transporter small permease [Alisedimentitalea sp. MJ-SS2]|uniref:TRAP transporter small permease n=1 Tax=Aliisedimentitalea sp. MJ-SS2 TaxID=3049795 RepID=UPI00290D3456|nr:TRAP transporter small permease [Alisedimentitalea sp. MJ-SS2]MDU8928298.1 TRAP transporter small permease [Alisedimentitalea sp. MJ-SS2]